MARPLRLEYPGAVYHVTARGNERQAIFRDDEDRRCFLRLLGREVDQQRWRCYAYCLMGNHYHVLVETPEPNLVRGMRRLNSTYSQAFNRRHRRVGHLFQGRYHAVLVEKELHLLALCRYIVRNPVRAGIVTSPRQWPWSSYRATAGAQRPPEFLDFNWILSLFGPTTGHGRIAYRRFVAQEADGSPWDHLRGQIWLGSESFRARMQDRLRGKRLDDVPEAQREPLRPSPAQVVRGVLETYALTAAQLWSRENQEAFRAAAYLLRRVANVPLREVGGLGGVSAARVSRIQREVERGRRSPRLDSLLRWYKVKI